MNDMDNGSLAPSGRNSHGSGFSPGTHRKQRAFEAELQRILDILNQCLTNNQISRHPRSSNGIDILKVRKALYTTIRKLAVVKLQDLEQLQPEIDRIAESAQRLDALCARRETVESKASANSPDTELKQATDLRHEAHQMTNDILEAEQKVYDLRRMQKALLDEAEQIENKGHARLSSYARDIQSLDRDIAQIMIPYQTTKSQPKIDQTSAEFSTSARSRLTHDLEEAQQQYEAASKEYEALTQGAIMWREVTKVVVEFEDMVAADTDARQRRDFLPEDDHTLENKSASAYQMHRILKALEDLITALEAKLGIADENHWKLLICAIGTELEAAKKGKDVLEAVLADMDRGQADEEEHEEQDAHDESSHGDEIDRLDHAFETTRQKPTLTRHGPDLDDDDEDDGPDPNLLISHQESDREDP